MLRVIDMIVVHAAATPDDMDIGVKEIRRWHRVRGFSDIGYHFVIRRSGYIELGRPLRRPGAHARGFNGHSIGICMVGGLDDEGRAADNFTTEQFQVLYILLYGLMDVFGLVEEQVWGHCDLPEVRKECPCFDVQSYLRDYLL